MLLPNPSDLILVTYMPSPRDMEIARLLGWYRIPLRTAPKVIAWITWRFTNLLLLAKAVGGSRPWLRSMAMSWSPGQNCSVTRPTTPRRTPE